MTLPTITPAIRKASRDYTDLIEARLLNAGLPTDHIDTLRDALELASPVAAQTAANNLELLMAATTALLPDDNLAKLRYLLAEGSPALEARHDFATPDDPGTDLHSVAAARAANAWLARRQTEGAAA